MGKGLHVPLTCHLKLPPSACFCPSLRADAQGADTLRPRRTPRAQQAGREDGVWPTLLCSKRGGSWEDEGLGVEKIGGGKDTLPGWEWCCHQGERGASTSLGQSTTPFPGQHCGERCPFLLLSPQPSRQGQQGITCPTGTGPTWGWDKSHLSQKTAPPCLLLSFRVCEMGMQTATLAGGSEEPLSQRCC